jgi:hypothetical protein
MDPDETDEERDTRLNVRFNNDREYALIYCNYGFDEVKDDVPEAGDSERRGEVGPHGEGGRSDVQRRDWGVECE